MVIITIKLQEMEKIFKYNIENNKKIGLKTTICKKNTKQVIKC